MLYNVEKEIYFAVRCSLMSFKRFDSERRILHKIRQIVPKSATHKRPAIQGFLCLHKLLNKYSSYRWFEAHCLPYWRHCNVLNVSAWGAGRHTYMEFVMMTSSNGNILCVTGPLCGEFTGQRWIPHTKATDVELWRFLWSAPWINGWVNTHEAGDLGRHCAHYDVMVMKFSNISVLRP